MDNLRKAYEAIEMLESLGLPVTQEQKTQIRQLEKQYIDNVIVPHIKTEYEPLLEDIIGGCHLIIEYNKKDGLTIRQETPEDKIVKPSDTELKIEAAQDRTKFSFNGGSPSSKRHIVLLVVKEYVKDHPLITLEELEKVFPAILMHPYQNYGVVRRIKDVEKSFKDYERRYFTNPKDIITLKDGTEVVVSTQFVANSFYKFLDVARKFYPNIIPVKI